MPTAPKWIGNAGYRFVINYVLAGCDAGQFLVVDLNSEAQGRLLLLFLLPDMDDLIQAIFEPGKGRRRARERHGRKRPPRLGIPDISDLIGREARAGADIVRGARLSGLRYAFPILNLYEGVAWTAAIIEASEDVLFERVLAIIESNPNECQNVPRLWRDNPNELIVSGAGSTPQAINMSRQRAASGFNTNQFGCSCSEPFTINISARVSNQTANGAQGFLTLGPNSDLLAWRSATVTAQDNEWTTVGLSANVPANLFVSWGWLRDPSGFMYMRDAQLFAAASSISFG
jgi:hypothetical protein